MTMPYTITRCSGRIIGSSIKAMRPPSQVRTISEPETQRKAWRCSRYGPASRPQSTRFPEYRTNPKTASPCQSHHRQVLPGPMILGAVDQCEGSRGQNDSQPGSHRFCQQGKQEAAEDQFLENRANQGEKQGHDEQGAPVGNQILNRAMATGGAFRTTPKVEVATARTGPAAAIRKGRRNRIQPSDFQNGSAYRQATTR